MEFTENKKYKEIHILDKLLAENDIPHSKIRLYDGWQIIYYKDENRIADVVQHCYSYGNKEDLLEIMGLCSDSVEGYLTAQEVFERIKKDYESY